MAEYIDREEVMQAKPVALNEGIERENDTDLDTLENQSYSRGWNACRQAFLNNIKSILKADVIERSEYEYLKKENRELAIKYDNAMNMVINEQENVTRLRSKIDKAIEEIRELPFASSKTKVIDGVKVKGEWVETVYRDDVLKILERCIGE